MSANLDLPQIAENQTHKEVTANDAFAALDAAVTELLSVDLTNDVTLTGTQWRTCAWIKVTTSGTGKKLTAPAVKRRVMVLNASTHAISVAVGSTTISLAVGAWCEMFADGTTNGLSVTKTVPAGGSTGQLLGKASATDFDISWITDTQYSPLGFNPQTDDYSLQTSDAGKLLEFNKGSAVNVTIPASICADGDFIEFLQTGAGQIQFAVAGGSGITLYSAAGKVKTNVQYSAATLIRKSSTTWYLVGDLA
jgi:hypothetical protein